MVYLKLYNNYKNVEELNEFHQLLINLYLLDY